MLDAFRFPAAGFRRGATAVTSSWAAAGGFAEGKADLSKLKPLAQTALDAHDAHPAATLADLYDPDTMPPALRRAHRALDRAVDRLYRRKGFATERERVEHLFALYEKMRAPLEAGMKGTGKKRNRKRNEYGATI